MKKFDETFQDYKKRMIDPVSDSFCAAKWLNSTIWLGHGQTASCHHPPSHQIDAEEIQHNPSAIHNTFQKKKARKQMLEGVRPSECEYCWKIEDMGVDAVSDRVYKTEIFSDAEVRSIAAADPQSDSHLRTLEVSFDRTCNFACSYCNPSFSTTWVKDIRANGPYTGLVTDRRNHFTHDAPYAQPYASGQTNPYIRAFWEWWPELSQTLEEIRITGGEPLMAVDVWKLFDWFEKNPTSTMRFAINSNLGAKPELIDRLIEKSRVMHDLHIYTSNEAMGAQAEYIRDGLDYAQWRTNIERLSVEGNVKQLHMMMTINGLCLFSITDFLDDMLELKRAHGRTFPAFTMNIVRFPSFQSPLVLPMHLREEAATRIEDWLAATLMRGEICRFEHQPILHEHEIEHTTRLVAYLRRVDEPHADAAPHDQLVQDFRTFYAQYDARRGKDLRATFAPALSAWLDETDSKVAQPAEDIDAWFADVMGDET
jgi:organic radical activating enzyme